MTTPGATADGQAASIVVQDATKIIEGVTVLDGVSFTARPGRVTAFLGPNGAGKSTTLRAILGIDHLTSGHTTIGGRPFGDHRQPVRVVGALLTPDAAHPRRTARGHLTVVATSNGLPRASVGRALDLAGIVPIAEVPVGKMSLGMRQRLGLATALIGDPAVVILDEPHNGLDAAAIRWLRVVLRALADAGRTVLLSSHLMSEIEVISDDVVIISEGRIRVASTMEEFLTAAPSDPERMPLEERYLSVVGEL
ncbi:MAG TPA: ATP-binding cassette domain-containing protein [Acidimicrobiales bacterium]|jgi:ABC-2 type transport system ATP-binding protein|nr:ATP-binding cassette domain-containing protein [Acidimicrobiales bacterium]